MSLKIGFSKARNRLLVISLLTLCLSALPPTGPEEARAAPEENIIETALTANLAPAPGFGNLGPDHADRSFHSDILYYETVLSYGTNTDIRNTFVLANAYITANQQDYGIDFFERLLNSHGSGMTPVFRAQHLAALSLLRATHADAVPLFKRIPWVLETFDLLEEALAMTDGHDPLVRWSAGIIYTRVPAFFFAFDDALTHLNWLAERPELEPLPGFYREVYRHLSVLHERGGSPDQATLFKTMSGFGDQAPDTLFMNWFTVEADLGTQMSAYPILQEVVPGRVFALFGFGFSDVYFVLSADGSQLIAIDAATKPERLKAAHDHLLAAYPELPEVSTLIVTHAHWDHIGGFHYLKERNPDLKIFGQADFEGTLDRVQRDHSYSFFRGPDFHNHMVADYRPDVPVRKKQEIEIGGSSISLIPQAGGETEDSLLVHFPKLDTVFVGDILMPYYGEPWVEEGLVEEAVTTMDAVIGTNARHILHGHRPLTLLYTRETLPAFKSAYEWLLETAQTHLKNGFSANDIKRLNLVPPGFSQFPEAFIGYIAARDHLVDRIADNFTGIWQEDRTGRDPGGLDILSQIEFGRMLEVYFALDIPEVSRSITRMLDNGDLELAFKIALAAEDRYGPDPRLLKVRNEAADRLRSKAQFFDPFKLVAYSEMTRRTLEPMAPVNDHLQPKTGTSALLETD